MMANVFSVLLLTAVYLLVLGSLEPWDWLIGALIGAVLLWISPAAVRPGPSKLSVLRLSQRILAFVPFAIVVFWSILKGTWAIGLVLVHWRPLNHPGLVEIPIGDRTRSGVAATAIAATLSPGSVFIDVDWTRRVMIFHMIDATDIARHRAVFERMYDKYQRRVFP